jgi:alkanesulfonate monooxygenase SsuD/methylene tetrahydromethanopterin reductase-like flavin-dependent oxidoreductase (luciferase family)
MRFSYWASLDNPWDDVVAGVTHAEEAGWDGVYLADHFMNGSGVVPVETPTLECTAALSALAVLTDRVRLASLVFGITYRHPAVLTNWAITADHLSGGRLLLGLGAGWQQNEHDQYGIPLGPPGERIDRFAEALAVVRGLLDQPTTTVSGDHYEVTDAIAEPKAAQEHLPILIGGQGDRMLGLVAEYADEWNMWSTPATITERRAALDQRCEAIGRDSGEIRTSTQALVLPMDDDEAADGLADSLPRPVLAGTPARMAETVAGWADAGVDEVIVPDMTLGVGPARADALDRLMTEVFAPFR